MKNDEWEMGEEGECGKKEERVRGTGGEENN